MRKETRIRNVTGGYLNGSQLMHKALPSRLVVIVGRLSFASNKRVSLGSHLLSRNTALFVRSHYATDKSGWGLVDCNRFVFLIVWRSVMESARISHFSRTVDHFIFYFCCTSIAGDPTISSKLSKPSVAWSWSDDFLIDDEIRFAVRTDMRCVVW